MRCATRYIFLTRRRAADACLPSLLLEEYAQTRSFFCLQSRVTSEHARLPPSRQHYVHIPLPGNMEGVYALILPPPLLSRGMYYSLFARGPNQSKSTTVVFSGASGQISYRRKSNIPDDPASLGIGVKQTQKPKRNLIVANTLFYLFFIYCLDELYLSRARPHHLQKVRFVCHY